jgi:hypothetical protein
MDREHIIAEIKRTAAANGGKPLGKGRFETETGIGRNDWYGKYWARWGDALTEAGYSPNPINTAYDEGWVIEKLIGFIRELGRYPVPAEYRMRSRGDDTFPGYDGILRFGRKVELAAKIIDYCSVRKGYEDVIEICRPIAAQKISEPDNADAAADDSTFGYVYLFKSGKHYKIGHSNSVGRREYELAIQLPERLSTVHTISTDDPLGIEAYWHKRFDAKRLNGEWFNLDAADIRAFKRRKFM